MLGLAVRTWLTAVVVFAFIMGLGAVIWGFKVATSDIKGRGDVEIIKNDGRNMVNAQELFHDRYNAIITADKNIQISAESLRETPNDTKIRTELSGQKMYCNDLVAAYNADTQKVSKESFRDSNLPSGIDDTNPNTDCKENTK